jgi:hypothetical protein
MWAAAILVVALVSEKQTSLFLLVILAAVSLMNLSKAARGKTGTSD